MPPKNSFTFALDSEQQERLHAMLAEGNFKPVKVPYTRIAVQAPSWDCNVNLYTSGKCLVQGSGAQEFVVNILEPMILQRIVVGYEEVLAPEALAPHMGVDESGKGDFFGPLVIAAAYTNEEIAKQFRDIGVKDSKAISSDKQALAVAAKIRGILGPNRHTVVRVGNATYNRLYAKMRNINRMLAWAHATAVEELLEKRPACPRVVIDQFAPTEATINRALKERGKKATIDQHHKAESDLAVAMASVIARELFLRDLLTMAQESDFDSFRQGQPDGQPFKVPIGSSDPRVRALSEEMVRKAGPTWLMNHCKAHFQTTDKVLSACGKSRADLPPEGQVVSASRKAEKGEKI